VVVRSQHEQAQAAVDALIDWVTPNAVGPPVMKPLPAFI
jgi:hypothetical protein